MIFITLQKIPSTHRFVFSLMGDKSIVDMHNNHRAQIAVEINY